MSHLNLSTAVHPIPDYGAGPDPYQAIQVHDYKSISFLRQDPLIKATSKKTIEVFQKYYPETMRRKFFVNVPVIMSWVFAAMKLFVAEETARKFTVCTSSKELSKALGGDHVEGQLPQEYGGKAPPLEQIGQTLKMEAPKADDMKATAVTEAPAAADDAAEPAAVSTKPTEETEPAKKE